MLKLKRAKPSKRWDPSNPSKHKITDHPSSYQQLQQFPKLRFENNCESPPIFQKLPSYNKPSFNQRSHIRYSMIIVIIYEQIFIKNHSIEYPHFRLVEDIFISRFLYKGYHKYLRIYYTVGILFESSFEKIVLPLRKT